jgi:ABC-type Fe3+-hydroxamate transport system substrate-binding protein
MKKIALCLSLVAATVLAACSGNNQSETSATEAASTNAATVDSTMKTQPLDNTATATPADTATADSVRHAHLHTSGGMVHNHAHSHPTADTAHRDQ